MNQTHIGHEATSIETTSEGKLDLLILTPKQQKNFDKKIDKSGGPEACWPWIGSRIHTGYGRFGYNKRLWVSHRIAYMISKGPIPKGKIVCHKCDNPPCCNPAHHWLGTRLENNLDKIKKGRDNPANGLRNGSKTMPHMIRKGALNGTAILSEDQVIEIRKIHEEGELNYPQIAAKFGVTRSAIASIVRRVTWKHLPPNTSKELMPVPAAPIEDWS